MPGWTRRAQEPAADGGQTGLTGPRLIAALHRQPGLGRRAIVDGAGAASGPVVGGADAYLVIDNTALPKKGTLSVGVARQYCGQLGKRANWQSLVSLTLAQGEVPLPVGLRLFLPDEWTSDTERCARACVPEAAVAQRSKGASALAELDRVAACGVRFGTVLVDAGYGASAAFRHGLNARGHKWAVGNPAQPEGL